PSLSPRPLRPPTPFGTLCPRASAAAPTCPQLTRTATSLHPSEPLHPSDRALRTGPGPKAHLHQRGEDVREELCGRPWQRGATVFSDEERHTRPPSRLSSRKAGSGEVFFVHRFRRPADFSGAAPRAARSDKPSAAPPAAVLVKHSSECHAEAW